ncbi:hypothetical protein CBS101457_003934 [Exobasidium rhododendri]|nr:hypothetical protein CBS101457_003934 [Exobasidium rhododendri]
MPQYNSHRGSGEGGGSNPFEATTSTISDAIASTTAYFSPFAHASPSLSGGMSHGMPEHNRLLAEVAPHIMRPRILSAAVAAGNTVTNNVSNSALIGFLPLTRTGIGGYSINQPARSLVRLGNTIRQGPLTSTDMKALEASYQILSSINAANIDEEIQEPRGVAKEVSLLRGFQATLPSNLEGRAKRRKQRGREDFHMGLKQMSDNARGLLINGSNTKEVDIEEDGELQQKQKEKRKARRTLANKAKEVPLTVEEVQIQKEEISTEKENLSIRRMLINSEIEEVEARIAEMELIKQNLQKSLLGLREEELELNDEFDGVSELLAVMKHRRAMPGGSGLEVNQSNSAPQTNSRRRKGPLFLPSEHDELPSGVAFMTLSNHSAPITALDFSEPYGTLVSSALDDTVRVWDLSTASEVGRLRGHIGTVKCLQVEDELCITGGIDSSIKLWDLHRVEDFETRLSLKESGELSAIKNSLGEEEKEKDHDPCLRSLEGHSKAVTSLYFDDTCLVTGASDKTLRQWDLNTGQCVLTMDILWAISNPTSSQSLVSDQDAEDSVRSSPIRSRHSMGPSTISPSTSANSILMAERNYAGAFSHPTPAFADGSWEMYQDFVGGVQFWGYALASGSGDGAVRMWDMRTGQAHRTLHGHTGPVTCLQFDETHIISGSLDKSIRIWDLRTGAISDTIRYDYPVTSLQFDSRKIMAATGENQIKIFNRTSLQQKTLSLNGHTSPVEKLRYMDRYAVSGGKDSVIKVWAL